jgi:hypothetical protein
MAGIAIAIAGGGTAIVIAAGGSRQKVRRECRRTSLLSAPHERPPDATLKSDKHPV